MENRNEIFELIDKLLAYYNGDRANGIYDPEREESLKNYFHSNLDEAEQIFCEYMVENFLRDRETIEEQGIEATQNFLIFISDRFEIDF